VSSKRPDACSTNPTLEAQKAGDRNSAPSPSQRGELLHFGLGTSFNQLLDSGFSVGLRHSFLHVLRGAIDQVLGFLQAEARQTF